MSPSQKTDSPKVFGAWLAALFLAALGAKLWVVQLFASPLPLWDQWYEARDFFRPWMDGHLTWQLFFAPDNGHRIFSTRLIDFIVLELNGRWEPLVQMTVNAMIHAVFICGLALCLWHFFGRRQGWFICCLIVPFYVLPYAGENAIWAINLEYALDLFSLAAMAWLGFSKPGSVWWWLGLWATFMSLFTMASGLLAPVAVGALMVLRMLKSRRMTTGEWVALALCFAAVGLGLGVNATPDDGHQLQAKNFGQFSAALLRNLAWPFFDKPWMAGVFLLPLLALFVLYFKNNFIKTRAADFVLMLGLWGFLQAAGLAYGRGNYGDAFPISRYLDILNIFIIASLFAVLLLAQHWLDGVKAGKFTLLPPLAFAILISAAMGYISQVVVEQLLLPTRSMNLVAEERVTTLWSTGSTNAFFQVPTVPPHPAVTLDVLRSPSLQKILPAVCLPPTPTPVAGRLAPAAQWLLHHAVFILSGGLILIIGLLGWGLIRDPAGIAWQNLPASVALAAALVATGFAWSKAPVKREVIEAALQYNLADQFKAAGNLERAAIHTQKAEALKNQLQQAAP